MGGGLDADELAADFVAGAGFPFEQNGALPCLRQTEGGGGTRRASADDGGIPDHLILPTP